MALRIRRGTESQRTGVVFNSGELVWTTDLQQLWVGDGVAQGGKPAVGLNITGYGLTYNTGSHKIEVSGLTTDDITQSGGANNRWFTNKLAQDAVAPLFTSGIHSNIEFQYDEQNERINATVTLDGAGLNSIEGDTTPTLGGDLTLNTFNIQGTGDIDITGTIDSTGAISAGGDISAGGNVAVTGTLSATAITGTSFNSDLVVMAGVDTELRVGTNARPVGTTLYAVKDNSLTVKSLSTGFLDGGGPIVFNISSGTMASPTKIVDGATMGALSFNGYTGSSYGIGGLIVNSVVGTPVTSAAYINSKIIFAVGNGSDVPPVLTLYGASQTAEASCFQATPFLDATARTAVIASPAAGMVTFLTSVAKLQVYTGSAWENLN
jgi:hypothetical protein